MKTIARGLRAAAYFACLHALAGCSTAGKLDNLITVSLSGDRAFATSLYGPIGITAELRADDARELRTMREKARMLDLLVRSTSGPGL